jgi:hypothetical protein
MKLKLPDNWKVIAGLTEAVAKNTDSFAWVVDWRDLGDEALKDLKAGLKKLGLFVYVVPGTEKSDASCLVISKKTMTKAQLKAEYDYGE